MTPVFCYLRMRVYVAWLMAETCCVLTTIGAAPAKSEQSEWTKTDSTHQFDAIRNIDIYECEFGQGFRSSMRGWNRSVQRWLAQHVYRRAPRGIG